MASSYTPKLPTTPTRNAPVDTNRIGCYPQLGVVNPISDTATQHVLLLRARNPRWMGEFPLIGGPMSARHPSKITS